VLAARPAAGVESPADFTEDFVRGLPPNATVLETGESEIGGEPAAVIRLRRTYDTGLITTQQLYAVNTNEGVWVVVSAAATEDAFDAALPEFDAITDTLRLN
jgi:hypothetical protein